MRFRWRDSKHNNRIQVMRLDAVVFIRRFLLHVLPAGFLKIRHFGLLANRNRRRALTLCRLHLNPAAAQTTAILTPLLQQALHPCCPKCQRGTLHTIARLSTDDLPTCTTLASTDPIDSS